MPESDPHGMSLAMSAVAERILTLLDIPNSRKEHWSHPYEFDNLFRYIVGGTDDMRDDPRILAVTVRRLCEKISGTNPQTSQEDLARVLHEFAGMLLIITDPLVHKPTL